MQQIGTTVFGFEVPTKFDAPVVAEMYIWVDRTRFALDFFHLPTFLNIGQLFVQNHQKDSSENEMEYLASSDPYLLFQDFDRAILQGVHVGPIPASRILSTYAMHGFDEALEPICAYVYDISEFKKRILCRAYAEPLCKTNVSCATIKSNEFSDTFEKLYQHFGASLEFTSDDWGVWHTNLLEKAKPESS